MLEDTLSAENSSSREEDISAKMEMAGPHIQPSIFVNEKKSSNELRMVQYERDCLKTKLRAFLDELVYIGPRNQILHFAELFANFLIHLVHFIVAQDSALAFSSFYHDLLICH